MTDATRRLAWVALAAAAIGVFLPWTSDGPVRLDGVHGPNNGWLVLITAAFALGWIRAMTQGSWVGVTGVLGAAMVIAWTGIENWIDSSRVLDASPGYGLLIVVAASAVLACAAATRGVIRSRAAYARRAEAVPVRVHGDDDPPG